jgi:MFS_1 like family
MCASPTTISPTHTTPTPNIIRPRVLFSTLYIWLSLTGGRFLAPQLQDAGLSEAQIGICLALQTVLSSICSAGSGSFADAYEKRHPGKGRALVLMGGTVVCTLAFLLQAIPWGESWLIAMRCIYAAASSWIHPVLDGLALDFLARTPGSDKSQYGKERLYGAVWWAITNLIMGPSLDYLGFSILYPYAIVACIILLASLALFIRDQMRFLSFQPVATEEADKLETAAETGLPPPGLQRRKSHLVEEGEDLNNLPFRQLMRLICGTGFAVAFLTAVFALSIGTAVVESLIFLYFEVLGSTYTLCAWTVVLTVIFEIPIFHVAPQLLEKFGTTNLLLLACFCYMTRVVGYSLIPQGQPWLVLFLEPLHGVTYACGSLSGTEFVAQLVPRGYDASGQGFLYALRGFGSIIGLLFGGFGEELLGARTTYRLLAAVVAFGFAVLGMASLRRNPEAFKNVDTVIVAEDLEMVDQTMEASSIGMPC